MLAATANDQPLAILMQKSKIIPPFHIDSHNILAVTVQYFNEKVKVTIVQLVFRFAIIFLKHNTVVIQLRINIQSYFRHISTLSNKCLKLLFAFYNF